MKIDIKYILHIIECSIIIDILQNLLFWININPLIPFFLNVFNIFLIIIFSKKIVSNKNTLYIASLILLLLLFIDQILIIDGITSAITKGTIFLFGIAIFSLRDIYKINILKSITNFFSVFFAISIIGYILFLIFQYPPISILNEPFGYDDHYNYIVFILPCKYLIPRFSGPFIEPGHMSIFCCFVLFANKFNFKANKKLFVYLIAILISLSLAGYILLGLSILLSIKIKIKTIFYISTIAILSVLIINNWEDGENPVSKMIFERLEYDEDKGIAGNNREKYGTDSYFEKIIGTNEFILGVGARKYDDLSNNNIIGGAGYKIYIIQYGIFGLLFAFLFYFLIAFYARDRRFSFRFFILISVCFLQRSYPDWIAWLMPYICSILPSLKKIINFNHYREIKHKMISNSNSVSLIE